MMQVLRKRRASTQRLIDEVYAILADYHPMTLRQVHYQLVSRQVQENTEGRYKALSRFLVDARRDGLIPWQWIEDRLRRPRGRGDGWEGTPQQLLEARLDMLGNGFERAIWPDQPCYVEVWLEKDALSGIFEDALRLYRVPYHVGRGYDSWSAIYEAAQAIKEKAREKPVKVLYFGDFDPSGEDMFRSLRDRLCECGAHPMMRKVSLTPEDIARYQLPPNFTKASDSRRGKHIAQHGDVSVELDALPPLVLRDRLIEAVTQEMDESAYHATLRQQNEENAWIDKVARRIQERYYTEAY